MLFKQIAHDIRRLRSEWRTWRAAAASSRRQDLGLAYLEAPVPGRTVQGTGASLADPAPATGAAPAGWTYACAVTELGAESRPVELVLDAWLEGVAGAGRGHLGYVQCDLHTRPRERVAVELDTDFAGHARVYVNGTPCPARLTPGAAVWPAGSDPASGTDVALRVTLSLRHDGRDVDSIVVRQVP